MLEIQTLTNFFMWCTIINGGLFLLWALFIKFAPDLVYRTQGSWVPLPRETFNVLIYSFLGLFKIVWVIFNVVPFVALLIIG